VFRGRVGVRDLEVSVLGLSSWVWSLIGTTGFEPATSSTPRKRATRLRHVPSTLEAYACLRSTFDASIRLQSCQ
jgi:hypothetical protein